MTQGRQLGSQYHLDSVIGRGGMGEVWRGADSRGNALAFKLLQPQFAEDPAIVHRFIAERQLLTSVRHPNVVGVRDLVAEGNSLAIVMDLVPGTDLRRHLNEQGTLPASEVCRIGAQVAHGLGAIHHRQIVHRDIKPENVLLDKSVTPPQVKLTDFGVAKLVDEGPGQSRATALAGTPMYMAPEVINGATPMPASDLYALGIVLYEMACGVTPFAGAAPGPTMQAQLTLAPGRPAGLDDQLWQIITALLHKQPGQRPHSAEAVAKHLEQLSVNLIGALALPRLPAPPPATPIQVAAPTQVIGSPAMPATRLAAPQSPVPGADDRSISFVPGFGSPQPSWSTPAEMAGQSGSSVPPGYGPQAWYNSPPQGWQGSNVSWQQGYATPQPVMVVGANPTPPPKNRGPIFAGVAVGLAIVVIGLIAAMVLNMRGDDEPNTATPSLAPTSVPEPSAPPSTRAPETSVVTVTRQPTTTAPGPLWPPAGATECNSVIAVNESTSCQFAVNVAEQYRRHGVGTVTVYSPVTGVWYDMTCTAVAGSVVQCTGGTNAVVYVRQ